MVQGDGFRLGVADVAGGGGLRRRCLILRLALTLQDRAGVGVDLILYLLAVPAGDLHLILCRGFVQLRIHLAVPYLPCKVPAEGLRSNAQCLVLADGHGRRARLRQILQLLHRELCKRIELQCRVDGENAIHQRRLAGRNAVFPGLLLPGRILGQGLRQDRRLCVACLQYAVHGVRQLPLKLFRPGGILVLHRDHNGGGNAAEVAVTHKAAYNSVHRHIQLGPLEVGPAAHIRKNGFCILIERRTGQHLFAPADPQLDAGIYIQGHHGRGRICLLVKHASAAQQDHRQTGGHKGCPFILYCMVCFHAAYRSFPHFTAGENAAHIVRRSLFQGRGQPLLHFFIGHRASSPSRVLRIFFNAL